MDQRVCTCVMILDAVVARLWRPHSSVHESACLYASRRCGVHGLPASPLVVAPGCWEAARRCHRCVLQSSDECG